MGKPSILSIPVWLATILTGLSYLLLNVRQWRLHIQDVLS